MSDNIPDIDQRIRARILEGQSVQELRDTLDNFFTKTGIRREEVVNTDTWIKAILLVQSSNAFNVQHDLGTDSDVPTSNDRTAGLRLVDEEIKALELDHEIERTDRTSEKRRRLIRRQDWTKWFHVRLEQWSDLKWHQWRIVILCAIGAALQGWMEAVINGAQTFYQPAFQRWIQVPSWSQNIISNVTGQTENPLIIGLVNSGPYLGCVISCWFSPLLNRLFGRRGTIFLSTIFSIIFTVLQARSQTWWELFIYRFFSGFGIGPKSVTIPIYVAETAPASIRGSLVMCWQVFTAFGIMLGCLTGIIFQGVGRLAGTNDCPLNQPLRMLSWDCSQNWRLMLGSPALLAAYLLLFTYGCCESPRWSIARAHRLVLYERTETAQHYFQHAWKALKELSGHELIAARDMLSHFYLLEQERKDLRNRLEENPTRPEVIHNVVNLLGHRRNRRGILASLICMFAQQYCGVNIIVYYSNFIFSQTNSPRIGSSETAISEMQRVISINRTSLYYTAGFGAINFIFATPTFFLIDTIGRRSLLLCTFPLLAAFHFLTMAGLFGDLSGAASSGAITSLLGMYLFGVVYSFGEGPVPFVYAAESMPLYCRELAMSLVVSVNWLLNWVVAYSGPSMFTTLKAPGTFAFYGGMCIACWFLILFFVPETRSMRLEELRTVFEDKSSYEFALHTFETIQWWLYKYKTEDRPPNIYVRSSEQQALSPTISRRLTRFERGAQEEASVQHNPSQHGQQALSPPVSRRFTRYERAAQQEVSVQHNSTQHQRQSRSRRRTSNESRDDLELPEILIDRSHGSSMSPSQHAGIAEPR